MCWSDPHKTALNFALNDDLGDLSVPCARVCLCRRQFWYGSLVGRKDEQFFSSHSAAVSAPALTLALICFGAGVRRRGWRSTISQHLWDLPFAPARSEPSRPEPRRHHRPKGRNRRGVRLLRSKQELERRLGRGSAGSISKQPERIHAGDQNDLPGHERRRAAQSDDRLSARSEVIAANLICGAWIRGRDRPKRCRLRRF